MLEEPPANPYDLLGAANAAVTPVVPAGIDLTAATALLERMGGDGEKCFPDQVAAVAHALAGLDRAGFTVPERVMEAYLFHLSAIAEAELAATPDTSIEDAVRYVVLGTALVEPLILALRRVAEQVAAVAALRDGDRRTDRVPRLSARVRREEASACARDQRSGLLAAPSSQSVSLLSPCAPVLPTWVSLIFGPFVMTCTSAMP